MASLNKPRFSNPLFLALTGVALASSLAGCGGGGQNPKTITIPIPSEIPTNSQEVQKAAEVAQPWIEEGKKAAGPAIKEAEQAAKQGLEEVQRESKKFTKIECKAKLPPLSDLEQSDPRLLRFQVFKRNNGANSQINLSMLGTNDPNRVNWRFKINGIDDNFPLNGPFTTLLNVTQETLQIMSSPNDQTIRFFDANGKAAGKATLTCSEPAPVINIPNIPKEWSNFLGDNGGQGER
jgi:hypothetical protein